MSSMSEVVQTACLSDVYPTFVCTLPTTTASQPGYDLSAPFQRCFSSSVNEHLRSRERHIDKKAFALSIIPRVQSARSKCNTLRCVAKCFVQKCSERNDTRE